MQNPLQRNVGVAIPKEFIRGLKVLLQVQFLPRSEFPVLKSGCSPLRAMIKRLKNFLEVQPYAQNVALHNF